MLKKYFYLTFLIPAMNTPTVYAQVFAGGDGDGFVAECYSNADPNPVYSGGNADGEDFNCYIEISSIYTGGNADGESFNCVTKVLPVELVAFETQKSGEKVRIYWSTASETDNDFFTIEKSIDGISWSSIGIVPSSGQSNAIRHYEFYDVNPIEGVQYYRLKQTDFNGTYSLSTISSEEYTTGSALQFTLSPNPTEDYVSIQLKRQDISDWGIRLLNVNGVALIKEDVIHENSYLLDLKTLAIGVYIVEVVTGNTVERMKLIKK